MQGLKDHEAVDETEFDRRRTRGEFAFHWQAHGLAYGIPRAALAPLNEGRTLIFNGSRAALAAAQAHDPSLAVVVITASDETLAQRLAARGRETRDEIAARLARGRFPTPPGAHIVENDRNLTTGVARFPRRSRHHHRRRLSRRQQHDPEIPRARNRSRNHPRQCPPDSPPVRWSPAASSCATA